MTSAYRAEPPPFELAGVRAYRNMGIGMLIMDSEHHVTLNDGTFSDKIAKPFTYNAQRA